MQKLRQDIRDFAFEISGIPESKEEEEEDEKRKHANPINWKPLLSDPYRGAPFNDWPWQVYENVVQLSRELKEENVDLIEQRFIRLKKYYYENRAKPKGSRMGVGYEYEKAYNKMYYSK